MRTGSTSGWASSGHPSATGSRSTASGCWPTGSTYAPESCRSARCSRARKRSRSTTTRVTCPLATSAPSASAAATSNRSSRPSTWTSSAVTSTLPPSDVARVCSSWTRVPTLVRPGPRRSPSAATVAASHQASSRGVASTSRSPLPMERAVSASATARVSAPRSPGGTVPLDMVATLRPWTRPTATSAGSRSRARSTPAAGPGAPWSRPGTVPTAGAGWSSRSCRGAGRPGACSMAYAPPLPRPAEPRSPGVGGRPAGSGDEAEAPQLDGEVVRVRRGRHGGLEGDDAVPDQRDEVLVEGLHAVVGAFLDQLLDRRRLVRVSDGVGHAAGVDADLHRHAAALTVGARHEPLADDAAEGTGEREPDLLLLVRGEEVDDAGDGLLRVGRVQRRHDEVTGL